MQIIERLVLLLRAKDTKDCKQRANDTKDCKQTRQKLGRKQSKFSLQLPEGCNSASSLISVCGA